MTERSWRDSVRRYLLSQRTLIRLWLHGLLKAPVTTYESLTFSLEQQRMREEEIQLDLL